MKEKCLVVVGLLAIIFGAGAGCQSCRGGGGRPKIALKPPSGPGKRPQGLPALSVTPGPQPFTQADVTAYFKTHHLPRNEAPGSTIQVDNLEFIRSGDVTTRLRGVATGLADSDPVAFATLSGTFIFTGPKQVQARFRSAYAVFDSGTGNLLLIG